MGLKNDLYNSIVEAFDGELSDAVIAMTLRKNNETFDPADNSVSLSILDYNTRGITTVYEESEINNNSIQPNDIKIILLQAELEAVPQIDDEIISEDGTFKIVNVMKDPSNTIWGLQCRQ